MNNCVEVKTEVFAETEEAPDRPSTSDEQEISQMKQEFAQMKEAFARNRKEVEMLRTLIQTIATNQEMDAASNYSQIRLLTSQMEETKRLNYGGGFPCYLAMPTLTTVLPAPPLPPPALITPSLSRQSSVTSVNSSRKANCIFCNVGKHESVHCSLYEDPSVRIAAMQIKNLCLMCLEPLNDPKLISHVRCPKPRKKCYMCQSFTHNVLFCDKPKLDMRKCEFCKNRSHNLKNCPNYCIGTSAGQRKTTIYNENRCFQCLRHNSAASHRYHANCPNEGHICQLCFPVHKDEVTAAHHPILCEHFFDNQLANAPRKTKATRSAPY